MENKPSDNRNQQQDQTSIDKNNQDLNKQKPNPIDPNQTKNHQVGENEESEHNRKEITSRTDPNKKQEVHSDSNQTGKKTETTGFSHKS